jgi:amino acid transporter
MSENTEDRTTHSDQHRPSLRGNAISVVGATVMSVVVVSPAVAMAFGPQLIASKAGAAIPFVFLLAMLAVLCIAYTIGQFTRWMSSAGSFYAFNSEGLGRPAGFVSGWILLFVYALMVPATLLLFGYLLAGTLEAHAGIKIPWLLLTLGAVVVIAGLSILGLGLSLRVDTVMLLGELVVFLVLAVAIVFKGGAHGNTMAVFNPSSADVPSSGLLFGLVFAFLSFGGFEVAATVSEETRHAHRNVSRALIASVVVTGVFFVFVGYAVTIGFGVTNIDGLIKDPLPLGTLGAQYFGSNFSLLIDLVVVFAIFSGSIGACNGLSRVLFALGRDRVLPPALSRVNEKHGTPHVAILSSMAFAAAVAIGLGLPLQPFTAFMYIVSVATTPLLLLYIFVGVSLMRYMWRNHRTDFRVTKHVLVPMLGSTIASAAVYGSYRPLPTGIFMWLNVGMIGYILTGVCMAIFMSERKPEMMRAIALPDVALD